MSGLLNTNFAVRRLCLQGRFPRRSRHQQWHFFADQTRAAQPQGWLLRAEHRAVRLDAVRDGEPGRAEKGRGESRRRRLALVRGDVRGAAGAASSSTAAKFSITPTPSRSCAGRSACSTTRGGSNFATSSSSRCRCRRFSTAATWRAGTVTRSSRRLPASMRKASCSLKEARDSLNRK